LACPYFMPIAKLENGNWPHPSRLPLGCGWSGHCTAPGHEEKTPSQDILQAFCNLGYATSCPWAPRERPWDAVRFSVSAPGLREKSGVMDTQARVLRLAYVCEKNHLPAKNGELEYDISRAVWIRRHDDPRIQKMAECYLDSYLKKN